MQSMYKLCLNIFLILIITSCSNQNTSSYPETKKKNLLKLFMDTKYQIPTDGLKILQAMILLIGSRDKINLLKHLLVKISIKKI